MAANETTDTIGNYDLLEPIGEGFMGTVYKARHWQTKELVAIKVMHAHIAQMLDFVKFIEHSLRLDMGG